MIFRPDAIVRTVEEIDFKKLIDQGRDFFVFDFDNTLGYWRSPKIVEGFEKAIRQIKILGGEILIASNGKPRELSIDGVRVLWRTRKPFVFKIKRILREKGISSDRVVVIGDQIFTDVLAGRFLKAYTIKVDPLSKREFVGTKVLRFLELIMKPFWKR